MALKMRDNGEDFRRAIAACALDEEWQGRGTAGKEGEKGTATKRRRLSVGISEDKGEGGHAQADRRTGLR